jgi:hypothetical protein
MKVNNGKFLSRNCRGVVQVAVMAPGVYDICDYLIRWAFTDEDKLPYSQPGPPLIESGGRRELDCRQNCIISISNALSA